MLVKIVKSGLLSTLSAITLFSGLAFNPNTASASSNYERYDGLAGEIKKMKICNFESGYKVEGSVEASHEGSTVTLVHLNVKARKVLHTYVFLAGYVPYFFEGYHWDRVANHPNPFHKNRRFYNFNVNQNPYGVAYDPSYSIEVGTRIDYIDRNGRRKTKYDLGGKIKFGTIPYGECRHYNDGEMS